MQAHSVRTLKALKGYSANFRAGVLKEGFSFSFAQLNDEIPEILRAKNEVTAALTVPQVIGDGKPTFYRLSSFDIPMERIVSPRISNNGSVLPGNSIQKFFFAERNSSTSAQSELRIAEANGGSAATFPLFQVRMQYGNCTSMNGQTNLTGPCYDIFVPNAVDFNGNNFPDEVRPFVISLFASERFAAEEFKDASLPCQNAVNQYDVNNDGKITTLDALNVINSISRKSTLCGPNAMYDVNNDGKVTTADALQIINKISAMSRL